MTTRERREEILRRLQASPEALSATALAGQLGVSRQVIVGDVALLRAAGENISATPRGYVLASDSAALLRTVACHHKGEETERELNIMVDNGCTVRDVIVEHPIYGQLTGVLDLKNRYDVGQFMRRLGQGDTLPLSALTDGVHLHTLLCPDEASFQRVIEQLREAELLFQQKT